LIAGLVLGGEKSKADPIKGKFSTPGSQKKSMENAKKDVRLFSGFKIIAGSHYNESKESGYARRFWF
jgi:hypothetical protein